MKHPQGSIKLSLVVFLALSAHQVSSRDQEQPNDMLREADAGARDPGVSPIRRIQREPGLLENVVLDPTFRTFDGSDNNPRRPLTGSAGINLRRLVPADYADLVSQILEDNVPGPREISNAVAAQTASRPNLEGYSDFLWQWGQFVDHDMDLTDGANPPEPADITVPAGDTWFDPDDSGTQRMSFNRSLYDSDTGTSPGNPRQQINEVTAWIDASNVYGSDAERAMALRTLDGTGRLKTSAGNLLPFNTEQLANAGGSSNALFLAGDVRANEQVGLTAMHVLFMREHNRQARRITAADPGLSGDQIYLRARRIVGAEMQVITYREYLPALLGGRELPPYSGYQPALDASISNLFSTGPYRYGHSALSPTLLRLDAQGEVVPEGNLALRDAFFAPYRIVDEGGIEPVLRGLASQVCQAIDPLIIDDVRNFLFGNPGEGGFDLAALNIQRGRDHGLPSYNAVREALGLQAATYFSDISSDPGISQRLASVYQNVDDVDVWVGGLAEDHLPGALVGELIFQVVRDQFLALRDGDRLWYQRTLNEQEIRMVENLRLSDIIRRNTGIGDELPDNVFRVGATQPRRPQ
jgi:peroxidase